MRKAFMAVLSAVFILGTAFAASAEDAGYSVKGKLVSIDPEGKTMVLRSDTGEEMTINIASTPTAEMAPTAAGAAAQQVPLQSVQPGATLKVDCMDVEGKFCAQRITVVPFSQAAQPVQEYIGKVTSIDPEKKAVVISTEKGVKTLYYQPTTTGIPLTGLETGARIKAYCLDAEGKACIKDINKAPEE